MASFMGIMFNTACVCTCGCQITKIAINLELFQIIQFYRGVYELVGGWVRSCEITKNWIKNNSILFEDLWFVETPPSMVRWVDGWGHVKSLTRKPVDFMQRCGFGKSFKFQTTHLISNLELRNEICNLELSKFETFSGNFWNPWEDFKCLVIKFNPF